MCRTMVMTLYSTGIRCSELCHLKVSDIDSERMVIRVHKGKGGRDRDVLLSPKLLDTLREYWRWMKPKTYLFPGTVNNWRADVPITPKVVWKAVNEAGKRAGINKRVAPHLLRHYLPFLTMSSDFSGCLPSFDNGARGTKRVDQSPDIVLLCFAASQAIEEPKQLVSWLIPPGLAARR